MSQVANGLLNGTSRTPLPLTACFIRESRRSHLISRLLIIVKRSSSSPTLAAATGDNLTREIFFLFISSSWFAENARSSPKRPWPLQESRKRARCTWARLHPHPPQLRAKANPPRWARRAFPRANCSPKQQKIHMLSTRARAQNARQRSRRATLTVISVLIKQQVIKG